MVDRIFGPIRGAGTQIIERDGEKTIQPGALGWAGYAGVLERGAPGTLMVCSSKKDLERKTGGLISDSVLPDVARSYFDTAAGAGGLFLVRITDGTERAAERPLYARRDLQTQVGVVRAKNGGRWGGKYARYSGVASGGGDITATALTTGLASTWSLNELAGGTLRLEGVPNVSFLILGNTAAGVISVSPDSAMAARLAAGGSPTNYRWYVELNNDSIGLGILIKDGEENPNTEFGLFIYLNGTRLTDAQFPNLSMDPASGRYWVNVINASGANEYITVEDTFTGTRTADVRPAGLYGISTTVTPTVLTRILHDFTVNSPVALGNPTFALGSTLDRHLPQRITLTMTSATAFTAVSDRFGSLGAAGTLGVAYVPNNEWTPPFTATAGVTPLVATDTLVINYKPLIADELINGYVFPDKVNGSRTRFRIVDNSHNTVTVTDGSDMTTIGAAADQWMIEAPMPLLRGRDGNAGIVDGSYVQQAWSIDTSPFLRIQGKGYGLVKFSTPGVVSSGVQQAGRNFADVMNHQYRYEVTDSIVDESAADTFVSDTLGRSQYAVVSFPSFCDIADPNSTDGRRKRISMTGMIHGREARIANDSEGYHKAGAGVTATLPAVLDLPTSDRMLNEELLNPRGIGVIKKANGNFIIWGDRTLSADPTWRYKHHREQFSYYEQVLRESFDFTIFALNNDKTRVSVKSALISFFLPEYRKNALDTDYTFEKACDIKVDTENNTAATKAQGDMFADVTLKLVETVERLRIRMGKMGVFEAAV